MPAVNRKNVSFCCMFDIYDTVSEIAKQQNCSVSVVINHLLRMGILFERGVSNGWKTNQSNDNKTDCGV